MTKLLLVSGCVLAICGSSALAQPKQAPTGPSSVTTIQESPQVAMAPDQKMPPRHRIAYTDQYGFHFDSNGLLVDANGYPITAHPR
jgi:hypothetical protein